MRFFVLVFLLLANSISATHYTTYIYDQSDLHGDPSASECVISLEEKKKIELDLFILNPMRKELQEKRRNLRFYKIKRFCFWGVFTTLSALSCPSDRIYMPFEQQVDLSGIDDAIPIEELTKNILELEQTIKGLEKTGTQDSVLQLEQVYVQNKPDLPELLQDKIESLLISMHQIDSHSDLFRESQKKVYAYLSLPRFSKKVQEGAYIDYLNHATNCLKKKLEDNTHLGEQILTSLAEKSRFFAYIQDESQQSEKMIKTIAASLGRPLLVVDMQECQDFSQFVLGDKDNPGLLYDVLTKRIGTKAYKNSILLLKNSDHWTMREDIPLLLNLFDAKTKTMFNPYLDMNLDVSELSIISSGKLEITDLSGAFQSRVNDYVL